MPLLMTSERLKSIRVRESKASAGPWLTPAEAGGADNVTVLDHEGCDVWPWERAEDMEFAYSSRADVPALLSHNDALVELLQDVLDAPSVERVATAGCGHEIGWDESEVPQWCWECRARAAIATHDASLDKNSQNNRST